MRVEAQKSYVLHTYPYSETSLIVDIFSANFGRQSLIAKGARRPRSALRGLLLTFCPLELSWSGKGEVRTLTKAEWLGGLPLLTGKALFCGYYLNELLMGLLAKEDAHEDLFNAYEKALYAFSGGVNEADLRVFEYQLLQQLGYGLTLRHDAFGQPIEAEAHYIYEIEHGAKKLDFADAAQHPISGQTLLDLQQGDFTNAQTMKEAKGLMRHVISHYTGGYALETRKIFAELPSL